MAATNIREKVSLKELIENLVVKEVDEYIKDKKLYEKCSSKTFFNTY